MGRNLIRSIGASLVFVGLIMQSASAATTGAVFAGGCPQGVGGLCAMGSNATESNVAALLGEAIGDVTQVASGFTVNGIGSQSDTWSISDTSITHIAFKSAGYFILGELTATSGDWDNNTSALSGWDITLVDCPAAICGVERGYTTADFLNNGGSIAALSNARAFSVVPIPAAAWLFGSGLGMLGWFKRRATVRSA